MVYTGNEHLSVVLCEDVDVCALWWFVANTSALLVLLSHQSCPSSSLFFSSLSSLVSLLKMSNGVVISVGLHLSTSDRKQECDLYLCVRVCACVCEC